MATLDNSNIVNGNVIQPNDLLQLYSAFTAGGGYDVSISGSLTGSATSATSATTATTATSASNITTAITGGGTHYLTFVDQAGTRPPKIASLLEYTAATNALQVTASRAVTASFALNAVASTPSTATVNTPAPTTQTLKPFAGSGSFSSGILNVDMGTTFPNLNPSALGVDLFLTATAASNTEYVGVSFAGSTLTFRSSLGGASSGTFYYVGWCK